MIKLIHVFVNTFIVHDYKCQHLFMYNVLYNLKEKNYVINMEILISFEVWNEKVL